MLRHSRHGGLNTTSTAKTKGRKGGTKHNHSTIDWGSYLGQSIVTGRAAPERKPQPDLTNGRPAATCARKAFMPVPDSTTTMP